MDSVKSQVTDFLNKCEEVKNCKFIMATTKIKDLLKSIVNGAELYELFNTVASKFDYIAAKERCFKEAEEDPLGRSRIVLPDTRGDRLAFIFCLLVEIDRGDIQINAFLQKYYPKDGSYYASYHMFCEEIIGSLESIISDVFARDLAEPTPVSVDYEKKTIAEKTVDSALVGRINAISILIAGELDFIASCRLSEEDLDAAATILTQLDVAVKACDGEAVNALACGYNYFIMYNKAVSDTANMLFDEIGGFLSSL